MAKTAAVLSAVLVVWLGEACVRPPQAPLPTRIVCGACEDQERFVRLQARSTNAEKHNHKPFAHPFTLGPEDWSPILSSICVHRLDSAFLFFTTAKDPAMPAFEPDEVAYLSMALNKAFAQAQPEEWVVFGSSRPNSSGATDVTTGAFFVEGARLHLLLANYRMAVTMANVRDLLWEDPLRPNTGAFYILAPAEFQSLVKREEEPIRSLLWPDVPELAIDYKQLLLSKVGDVAGTGISAAHPDKPGTKDSAGMSLEARLETLKRLKDHSLITDEEFQAKKKELLDRL